MLRWDVKTTAHRHTTKLLCACQRLMCGQRDCYVCIIPHKSKPKKFGALGVWWKHNTAACNFSFLQGPALFSHYLCTILCIRLTTLMSCPSYICLDCCHRVLCVFVLLSLLTHVFLLFSCHKELQVSLWAKVFLKLFPMCPCVPFVVTQWNTVVLLVFKLRLVWLWTFVHKFYWY